MNNTQQFLPVKQERINSHIHVSVRLKPLSEIESTSQKVKVVEAVNSKTIKNINHEFFHFDSVFDPNISNQKIFKDEIQPMIQNAIKGYNTTVLAYGQTSSGKTHTITGNQN